jgi:YVTN family beta-propeller protein
VAVINADSGTIVGLIPNTPGVHGIAIAAGLGKGFISNGRSGSVTVFALPTLKERKTIPVGENPDAILYDQYSQRVFVFNGRSHTASVLNADSENVVATIPLGGKPEFGVTDNSGRIFVNIEDKSEVLAIDARTATILSRWPLSPGEEPSGLAIDIDHHRLFSVCGNQRMIVLDSENGKVLASLPIGRGTDGCVFDPELGYAFASNGEGTVTVVREESPLNFTVLGTVPTLRGARTIALDPQRHTLFLPTAEFGTAPERTADRPRSRPPIKPDTFQILRLERP